MPVGTMSGRGDWRRLGVLEKGDRDGQIRVPTFYRLIVRPISCSVVP